MKFLLQCNRKIVVAVEIKQEIVTAVLNINHGNGFRKMTEKRNKVEKINCLEKREGKREKEKRWGYDERSTPPSSPPARSAKGSSSPPAKDPFHERESRPFGLGPSS